MHKEEGAEYCCHGRSLIFFAHLRITFCYSYPVFQSRVKHEEVVMNLNSLPYMYFIIEAPL